MRLVLHVVWQPCNADGAQLPDSISDHVGTDVIVESEPGHTVADLCSAVVSALPQAGVAPVDSTGPYYIQLARSGRIPRPDRLLRDVDIVDGDTLILCRLGHGTSEWPSGGTGGAGHYRFGGVALEVVAGPDACRSFALQPGTNRVGRSPESQVVLNDAYVSRDEMVVRVTASAVTVTPTGSTNGVRINGDEVDAPTAVSPSDIIAFGETYCYIRAEHVVAARTHAADGAVNVFRTPYRPPDPVEQRLAAFGPIPGRGAPRRFGLIAVLAPLGAGIGMYLLTQRLMFLLFTALSPIMALGRVVEDRRNGTKDFRRQTAEFRVALRQRQQDLSRAASIERRDRSMLFPDCVALRRRVAARSATLWARHRRGAEFGTLRLGIGPQPNTYGVDLAEGGEPSLRAEARAALEPFRETAVVPITVNVVDDPVVGIFGPRRTVDALVASMVLQAAALHSPADLLVAVAASPARCTSWIKWLPHVRPDPAQLPVGHITRNPADGRALVAALNDEFQRRQRHGEAGRDAPKWPRWLVVIDAALDLDPADIDRLLSGGPDVGLSVLWLAPHVNAVVRHADRVIEVGSSGSTGTGRLWSTDPERATVEFLPEQVGERWARRCARDLSPLRDATADEGVAQFPALVPIWELLGVDEPDASWIRQRWDVARRPDLRGVIGVGRDGPVEVDLVHHGPHTLIGGTSGAGKSELLQSLVLSLATRHPPEHVNLLFIDYKGGASSQMFARLPHTVGLVTNLDEALARRALESLRAELGYRMRALAGRAKDITELAKIDPAAPPALVIVCDEFATLIKEIPDFVAGIVDIAQRGRSLGVHLILATQRPAGAVNDDILANTNLRIALRTIDASDSMSILDAPDAAMIPVDRPGRCVMRVGSSTLTEIQTAFSGAASAAAPTPSIRVEAFDSGPYQRVRDDEPRPDNDRPQRTQLDVLVDSAVDAHGETGRPLPRRPWLDPLPDVVHTAEVCEASGADESDTTVGGSRILLGLADRPDLQRQHSMLLDLDESSGLIVFGSPGAGKTTLVRSIAHNAADVAVVVFDGASRPLADLAGLSNVVEVAAGDDPEAMTRLICVLEGEIARRRQADSSIQPNIADDTTLVLIDDWGAIVRSLDEAGSPAESWVERLQNVVASGRAVGVYTVATADQAASVSARVQATIGGRLVMRHADYHAYLGYGIPSGVAASLRLPPGRGLIDGTTHVQVALPDRDASRSIQHTNGARTSQVPRRESDAISVPAVAGRLRTAALPDRCIAPPVGPPRCAEPLNGWVAPLDIGIADVTAHTVSVSLARSHMAVAGPPGAGRSTAVAQLASAAWSVGYRIVLVGPDDAGLRRHRLVGETGVMSGFGSETFDLLNTVLDADRSSTPPLCERPTIVCVDDLEDLDDACGAVLDRLWRSVRVVASLNVASMTAYSTNPVVNHVRKARRMLYCQPDDPTDVAHITGCRVRVRPGVALVPGRGVIIEDRRATVMQVFDGFSDAAPLTPAPNAAVLSETR